LAKYNNNITAIILNVTAPDGYNGNIDLLVAISIDKINNTNKILNIKILNHQETPGLGDLIEPSKSNWLQQFKNKYLNGFWGLKKDNPNNQFDSITGATITSRAINNAIKKSLLLITEHPKFFEE